MKSNKRVSTLQTIADNRGQTTFSIIERIKRPGSIKRNWQGI